MLKTRLAALALALLIAAGLSAVTAVPAAASSSTMTFPDLTGKTVSVVKSFVKNASLKSTYTGHSLFWRASSYVVASQKPAAGTVVHPGSKVSFRVAKKTDIVNGNVAGGACILHARSLGAIPDGSSAVMGGIPAAPAPLGVIVRIPVVNASGEITNYIKCQYSGTKKDPKLVSYELQGALG
jgi:hypothetical protein